MEQPTDIYPELVLGDPNNPDMATVIIGRQGDSAQLLLAIATPDGAAVVANFVPDAGLEIVMSTFILMRASEVVSVSSATAELFDLLSAPDMEEAAND